jgi:hypothetical protein
VLEHDGSKFHQNFKMSFVTLESSKKKLLPSNISLDSDYTASRQMICFNKIELSVIPIRLGDLGV